MSEETKAARIQFWGSITSAIMTIIAIIVIALLGATTFSEWENTREINRRIYDQRYSISQEFHENIMDCMNAGHEYFVFCFIKRNTPAEEIDEMELARAGHKAFLQFNPIIHRLQHNSAMSKILFENEEISKKIYAISKHISFSKIAKFKSFEQYEEYTKPILLETNHILTLMSKEIYCRDEQSDNDQGGH